MHEHSICMYSILPEEYNRSPPCGFWQLQKFHLSSFDTFLVQEENYHHCGMWITLKIKVPWQNFIAKCMTVLHETTLWHVFIVYFCFVLFLCSLTLSYIEFNFKLYLFLSVCPCLSVCVWEGCRVTVQNILVKALCRQHGCWLHQDGSF